MVKRRWLAGIRLIRIGKSKDGAAVLLTETKHRSDLGSQETTFILKPVPARATTPTQQAIYEFEVPSAVPDVEVACFTVWYLGSYMRLGFLELRSRDWA